jgi:hypothetical protein
MECRCARMPRHQGWTMSFSLCPVACNRFSEGAARLRRLQLTRVSKVAPIERTHLITIHDSPLLAHYPPTTPPEFATCTLVFFYGLQ